MEGCSPRGRWGSDTTEQLHFHFSLSCIREGNGNPLQCSCLEIPGTGEPDGLPSMGSHRVEYDWSDLAAAAAWYDTLGELGVSLEVQWLRIHLLMQVHSLVWKDPTCHGTAKPEHHSYWALEPGLHSSRSRLSEKPFDYNQRVAPTLCKERKASQQRRPSTAKIK